MKDKLRSYWPVVVLSVWMLFNGGMVYFGYSHPGPGWEKIQRTPISWIDVFFGFGFGAIAMFGVIFLPITLPLKKKGGNGPCGDDNNPTRRISLPMLGKVVSIEDLKKMPPKGPVQLAPTGS